MAKKKGINVNGVEQAACYLVEIRGIQDQLKKLHKMLKLASEAKVECSFGIKIRELDAINPVQDIFDAYGFIKSDVLYDSKIVNTLYGPERIDIPRPPSKHELHMLNYSLEESMTMTLIGVLIKDKYKRKGELIDKLKALGIDT